MVWIRPKGSRERIPWSSEETMRVAWAKPEAAKEQAKRREFWEEPTSLRKGLGGGALEGRGFRGRGGPTGLLFMGEKWAEGKRRGLGKGRVSRSQTWKGRGVV